MTEDDAESFLEISNYYVSNGYQAYVETFFEKSHFDSLMQETRDYPTCFCIDEETGRAAGYSFVRAYNNFSTFSHTVKITYFLSPDYTGRGIGSAMLDILTKGCRARGVSVILASISALNQGSLDFHTRHGFVKCGEFENVICKNGFFFNEIWMIKKI